MKGYRWQYNTSPSRYTDRWLPDHLTYVLHISGYNQIQDSTRLHGLLKLPLTWSGVVGPGVEPAIETSEALVRAGSPRLLLFCTSSTVLESMGCSRVGLMGSSDSVAEPSCKGGRGSSNCICGIGARSASAVRPGCAAGGGLGGGEKAAFISAQDLCSSQLLSAAGTRER